MQSPSQLALDLPCRRPLARFGGLVPLAVGWLVRLAVGGLVRLAFGGRR